MIRKDIKNTLIYFESNDEEKEYYFSYVDKKFIHNVDTFYYSVHVMNDNSNIDEASEGLQSLIADLSIKKENVISSNKDVYYFEDIQLLLTRKRFKIYEYCLSVNNMFDIFISSYIPNVNTPRIVVQLRSIGLWLEGVDNIIINSFQVVERILNDYGLTVKKVQENRIDYSYHTNYIQNPSKYFDDTILRNNLNTTFSIYQKVGRKNNKELTVEYLSLGQRSSNNLFFRIYNKTREVLEMNYKGFFLDYWYRNKLISFYDKFVLEYAYKKGSYEAIEWGKLEFYLKYGHDINIKKEIELLKNDYATTFDIVRDYVKGKLPNITLILNIEFQTMRKFYYYSDSLIDSLETCNDNKYLQRLFKILDNRKIFLDYLTSTTVSFVKNDKYMDWWNRLRNLKISCKTNLSFERDYSRSLEIEKLKSRLKGTVASINTYYQRYDTDLSDDMSAVLCILNDNDIEDLNFVNFDTGEIIEICNNDYAFIKEKKKKSLKSLLKKQDF